jgi:DNA replication protein
MLFTEYKQVGLCEKEVMLLVHIILFREKHQKFFPTVGELQERMNLTPGEIIDLIQHLVHNGFLYIEEDIDEQGLRCERYCTMPLIQKLIDSFTNRKSKDLAFDNKIYNRLFQLFEQLLGRPLSPLECESLTQWIDEDGYSEELIEAALREAAFCEKVNFRYIDRILLEWQQNNITSVNEAIHYSRRFRKKGILYGSSKDEDKCKSVEFSFYNWINQNNG